MTPAHLDAEGHGLADVGLTISLHVAGMYAMAPVFGWLSDKFGARKTIVLGQMIFIISLLVAGLGQSNFVMVIIGLALLGIGWSASTVAASALLSETLGVEQRSKVQGFSDSLMNFSGAFGGAVAGTILATYSFSGLNAAALLPVVLIVFATSFARNWR
jgi:MFS family permease